MSIIFGDQTCRRCGDNYFSEGQTDKMAKHNLCFNCILEFNRKYKHKTTLESFAEGIRETSHYKI